jgi:hypothetical protein
MADQHNGDAVARDLANQASHLSLLFDAERRRRLVKEQGFRTPNDAASDRDRLSLAAGKSAAAGFDRPDVYGQSRQFFGAALSGRRASQPSWGQ